MIAIRTWLWMPMVMMLAGCPVGPPESGTDPTTAALPDLNGVAGTAAQQGGDALNGIVLQATRDRFPEPPSVATLCRLDKGHTNYEAAKKIMGVKPQGESMDAMMAGISYRFRPVGESDAGSAGHAGSAGAGGAAIDGDDAEPVTLYLSFAWSDGDVGWGTKIFGIGGSPEDFLRGYILDKMSISGMPYPDCWPHEED